MGSSGDLQKGQSIIMTKPDKGKRVVIDTIDKLDYFNKMKLLVSHENKLKKLMKNPTKSKENSLILYICKLKDKIIDDAIAHLQKSIYDQGLF